ncbi:MAG TPA: hypothetical protein VK815_10360, partial [Candidatus Acidoferrales bacterium]|nr:hypothetical protein [Candidatus Acidoferrales bacterium]
TLVLNGANITNKTLTLNGPGAGPGWGSLDVESGTNSWAGPVILNADSTIDVYIGLSQLHINGPISGAGGFEQFGALASAGTLFLEGPAANTYAGQTTVDVLSTLSLSKAASVHSIPGNNLSVAGTVQLLSDDQVADGTEVNIQNTGQVLLNTHACYMDGLSGSGKLDLGTAFAAVGWAGGTSAFNGIISGPGTLFTGGFITLNGNNTYTGPTYIDYNELVINGSQPQSQVVVNPTCTLAGTGTVNIVQANGILSPGNLTGILNSSNVTFSATGTFKVELNGTNTGAGYSQLNVTGTVALASASLQVLAGTVGATNNHYTIINNDVADAVSGTFAGLAEGATLVANDGAHYTISYHGGSGNDVVLTQTSLASQPAITGIQKLPGGGMQLGGIGISNLTYTVQANTNLITATWVTIGTASAPVNTNVFQFTDPQATNYLQRFYRFSWP